MSSLANRMQTGSRRGSLRVPNSMTGGAWDGGFEVLSEDDDRVLCRGWRRGDDGSRRAVLIVLPAADPPSPSNLDRFAREFALRIELDGAWAAKPLELAREGGGLVLVLEDAGGEPLERFVGAPMEVGRFLRVAIGIAAALGHLHARGLVHKDVKPANILVNSADAVRLTGFGIASRLARQPRASDPSDILNGTLAYMAPEQTGRMNRSVDSRGDLYALGVTLYEMLTGALPFIATDPIEWVHCHVAKRPLAPSS
jgi:serine/threonine protein kinase